MIVCALRLLLVGETLHIPSKLNITQIILTHTFIMTYRPTMQTVCNSSFNYDAEDTVNPELYFKQTSYLYRN